MALPFSAYMQPQLALTNFRLRSRPKSQPGPLLELKGRPSGVFYTILNLFGLSPIAELKVNNTEIRQHTKNLLGDLSHIIPLRHVDSVGFGSSKPILYLVLAVNCLFLGVRRCHNRDNGLDRWTRWRLPLLHSVFSGAEFRAHVQYGKHRFGNSLQIGERQR